MDTPTIDRVVDLLVRRHRLTAHRASAVLDGAARRKGVTVADIADLIWNSTPLPKVA